MPVTRDPSKAPEAQFDIGLKERPKQYTASIARLEQQEGFELREVTFQSPEGAAHERNIEELTVRQQLQLELHQKTQETDVATLKAKAEIEVATLKAKAEIEAISNEKKLFLHTQAETQAIKRQQHWLMLRCALGMTIAIYAVAIYEVLDGDADSKKWGAGIVAVFLTAINAYLWKTGRK